MNAFTIMAWLNDHPGLFDAIKRLPNLRPGTTTLLYTYVKRMADEPDPEAFLIRTLEQALNVRERGKPVSVEVIDTRNLPKRR